MARARKTEYVEVSRQVHGDVVHECVIFFRDPFWYWRISLDGGSSYSKGSTKSRNRDEATEAAKAKFYEFKAANRLGIKPSKATVSSLIDRFLSSPNLVLTSPTMADAYRMKAPILKEWFKDMPPHKVTGRVWQDYLS